MRAHPNGPYRYDNGCHQLTLKLTGQQQRRLEMAMNVGRFLFHHLSQNDVERDWDMVFNFLQRFELWDSYAPIEDFQIGSEHWASTAAIVCGAIPWRIGK